MAIDMEAKVFELKSSNDGLWRVMMRNPYSGTVRSITFETDDENDARAHYYNVVREEKKLAAIRAAARERVWTLEEESKGRHPHPGGTPNKNAGESGRV